MEKIIQVKGLKKSYGNVQAVNGIDFTVDKGSLFAFLGPNGAGKSTTIEMITTLLKPDEGSIQIENYHVGKDDGKIRDLIGIVFQDNLLDKLLTVRENLMIRSSFYGLKGMKAKDAIERVSESVGISEFIDRQYGKLSGGQRRRSDIARALINTPKLLFLDEPTTGLDPQTRKNVWEMIRRLQKTTDMTIFLTTHYMEEAAAADQVTIIDHGKVMEQGSPLDLKSRFSKDVLRIVPHNEFQLTNYFFEHKIAFNLHNEVYEVHLDSTVDAIPILENCRRNIKNVEIVNGSMDDVFLNITGRELREA